MSCTTSDVVVDLSHWQANPDFKGLAANGVSAVILKATQGSDYVDPTFVSRYAAAISTGLLVGAYHFCDATSTINQVHHFLTIAGSCTVLALDIEENGTGDTVTIKQAADIVSKIQMNTNKLPLIYLNRYGPDGKGTGLPNQILSRCPLWLAEYSTNSVLPEGWNDYTFWQYTQTGSINNYGPINRSKYNGTIEQLKEWWES